MARIKALENIAENAAVITVEGVEVGKISQTEKGVYSVSTNGLLPVVDGVAGGSLMEAWSIVVERVQEKSVFLNGELVHIGPNDRQIIPTT